MFSCDCHPRRRPRQRLLGPRLLRYGEVLGGTTFGMTKAERLLTRESTLNHCMMFCGVNLDENGKADRWKIENSGLRGDASGQRATTSAARSGSRPMFTRSRSQEPAERCSAPCWIGAPAHEAVGTRWLKFK